MDLDWQWVLLGLPVAFALGWIASRVDLRQWRRHERAQPKAYFKGLNHLLNEQPDKAIDAFIEAVQNDPDTTELHFALGSLFRRRGEFERSVRVHQHLLARADLPQAERERAQYALALDFMKAGLFDRAEEAFEALAGSPYDTEARLALLQLHERARDWRAAADDATALERAGAGSFASRIAHHWCELALEADARGDETAADAALQRARDSAGASARPWVIAGQRHARAGRHAEAIAVWNELRQRHPAAFVLVAREYAASAKAQAQSGEALAVLHALHAEHPSHDLMAAIDALDADAGRTRERHTDLLARQQSLGAAATVLRDRAGDATDRAVLAIVERAAAPLARYRCAACGFEAQRWFWQCPGCLGWDTFPPQRIEAQ
ncbi:MAG TPA: lipopolysaccharide assembly protein LapB [Burkholderiaceae bacterium]|nr:lipopolysaccharide assembly protein LapB [Burkholderiaceae bacterium]